MRRGWLMAGVVVAVLVGTVAVAQARGMGGLGMMGGGQGYGMMGGGMMMGGGGMPCQGGGANFDPATAGTHVDAMLARHQAVLTQMEAQLAAATDANVKAVLTTRIEQQKLMIGAQEARAAVLKAPAATWEETALAAARAEVGYWESASATDPVNKAWIALRLEQAKRQVTYLEGLQAK